MATGYTYPVKNGEITELNEFVLSCARAMGPFIMQRDDPHSDLPKKIEERSYAQQSLDEYTAQRNEWINLTDDQRYDLYVEYAKETVKSNAETMREAAVVRERYENMLAQVRAWRVTDEVLEPLRNFMIQQLEDSLEWDAKPYTSEIKSLNEWVNDKYDLLDRMVKTYEGEVAKEKARVEFQHQYTEALYKSLGMEYDAD